MKIKIYLFRLMLYIFFTLMPFTCFCQQTVQNAATAYNAGVTDYRSGKFVAAQKNFEQALELAGTNTELSKRSQYNLAASCLQHAQEVLPEGWEKKEVDSTILEQSIQSATQSIETLKKFLQIYPDDKKAATALKHAEALLKKLEEKKKQQKKDKQEQQDKKEPEKKDQEQKENKDKQKEEQEKDQNKQDKQDPEKQKQEQKEEKKQDKQQDQQKQGEGQGDSKKEEGKGKSENKEHIDQKKKEGNQDQSEHGRESELDKPDDHDAKGDDQKSDHEKNENAEKRDTNQEHALHPQPSDVDGNQDDQEMQEIGNENLESLEKRGLRAILENLQADETKAQKRLLQYQTGQNKSPSTGGQKPW